MSLHPISVLALVASFLLPALAAQTAEPAPPTQLPLRQSAWLALAPAEREQVLTFAGDIKSFLGVARQNQLALAEGIRRARARGFTEWKPGERLAPGARFYVDNRGRALLLGIQGRAGGAQGFRIVGTHADSPWLELKANPLIAKQGLSCCTSSPTAGSNTISG